MSTNPQTRLDELLESSGATLIRNRKHLVYSLPNNRRFTRASTPSDHRSAHNSISNLRRALGIATTSVPPPVAPPPPQPRFPPVYLKPPAPEPSSVVAAAPEPQQAPAPEPVIEGSLRERLNGLIESAQKESAAYMEESLTIDRYAQMLSAILPFADEPMTEAILALLVPTPAAITEPATPTPPPAPPAPAPPPASVSVTRDLVLDAIAKQKGTFTVSDIFDVLAEGVPALQDAEARRTKNLIGQSLNYLRRTIGVIEPLSVGRGGTMSIWSKCDPNRQGTRVAVYEDPAPREEEFAGVTQ